MVLINAFLALIAIMLAPVMIVLLFGCLLLALPVLILAKITAWMVSLFIK